MLKNLKKFFVYKKPTETEFGFEFPEDSGETDAWDQYRGNESNLDNQNENQNCQAQSRKNGRNQKNEKSQEHIKSQLDVQNKLFQMLKEGSSQKEAGQNDQGHTGSEENTGNQNSSGNQNNTGNQQNTAQGKEDGEGEKIPDGQADQKDPIDQGVQGDRKNQEKQKQQEPKEQQEQQENQNDNGNPPAGRDSDARQKADEKGRVKILRVITPLPVETLVKDKTDDNRKSAKQEDVQSNKKNASKSSRQSGGKSGAEKDNGNKSDAGAQQENSDAVELTMVSSSLQENIRYLKGLFHIPANKDVIIREFNIDRKIPACLIFVDGMIASEIINQFILPELMFTPLSENDQEGCPLDFVKKNVISINQIQASKQYKEIIQQILSGLTVLFIEGCSECLIMESRGFERRSVSPPTTETVVNGAQEGFTETLRTNVTLVRRIIKNENLVTEFEFISKTNNFLCALMYMEGITNPRIVEEVKRRMKSLDIDYISGSGMLEQMIEDKPNMIFPQIIATERPDRTASFLMEGKAVIICEGTPFALAMPITFFDLFHTSEESNLRHQYATFIRIIRITGVLIAALLPGMYTALILYHQEMIPTALLFSIVSSRLSVPFPTIVEIILMEFSFELIREGGIRVPGVTGNTLGIIGALIMGQAAVSAGLVSPILIIIVAVSGLGSFAIPNYSLSLAVRIIRFVFIIFGALAGFYGVSVCFTMIIALALGMKSFGVPFFAPMSPQTRCGKDKIVRGPIYEQKDRPDFLNPDDKQRMADNPRKWTSEEKGGENRA